MLLTVPVWGAENMNIRRQHHVVELLREHGRRKERDRPQCLLAGIGEVVPDRGGNDKHAAGADRVLGTVFQARSPVPARMYWVSSVASVCQPSRPPGSIS